MAKSKRVNIGSAKAKKPKAAGPPSNSPSARQARRMRKAGTLGSTANASSAASKRNNPFAAANAGNIGKRATRRAEKKAEARQRANIKKGTLSVNMRNAMRRGARARLGGGKRVAGSAYKH